MFYGLLLSQHVHEAVDLDINPLQLILLHAPYQQIDTHQLHLRFHAFSPNPQLVNKPRNQQR